MKNITVAIGTRPEAIKLCPLAKLFASSSFFSFRVVCSGQHTDLVSEIMELFDVRVDRWLGKSVGASSIATSLSNLIGSFDQEFRDSRPDIVVVQGDTSTVFSAALSAFTLGIPVAHVEAGLRTNSVRSPFPEEFFRRCVSQMASYHFAPTLASRDALIREGHPISSVFLTGNTVIDALMEVSGSLALFDKDRNMFNILMTCHRRENFGLPIQNICMAINEICMRYGHIRVTVPVHPNPQVGDVVRRVLGCNEQVSLFAPLSYARMVSALQEADIVMTDSGGLQEEAPVFGKPVLVLRNETERMEGVLAGCAKLVGTSTSIIVEEASKLIDDKDHYFRMARAISPYGDGKASQRIFELVERMLDG